MPRTPKTTPEKPVAEKSKPATRRKARPKFEVQPDHVASPAAGWAYRDREPAPEPVRAAPVPTPPPAAPASSPANSLPMMAFGAFATGIGMFVHVTLYAIRTLNAPVRLAAGMMNRMRG